MNSNQPFNPIVLVFPVIYVSALYVAVLRGDCILDVGFEQSWEYAPDVAAKLKSLLYVYPAASIPLSVVSLAVLAQQQSQSSTKMSVFFMLLAACVMGNLMAFQGGKLLVGWSAVNEWSRHVGSYRLNILTTIVAPVSAFVVAFLAGRGILLLKDWLKPE